MNTIIPIEAVSQKIFIIRGMRVVLDVDLADLYQVPTMRLNEQVKRNIERFPTDFMFQLTKAEYQILTSQSAISRWGGRRTLPYVFTEHGVAMLSSVLRSPRAIQMNIFIVRAFIKLRELLATNRELAQKVEELERNQERYGQQITEIHGFLKRLTETPLKPKEQIGFRID